MPQQNISKIGIGTNDFIIKDETLTNNVTNLIEIISGNNNSIVNRINDLNNRAFDAEIKISSVNESEISNIVDGLYKVKYITITGEGDNATETLNNSAVLIQKGTNQYLIKDGQISSRTKTDNTWGNWTSTISLVLSPEYEISSASNSDLALESGDTYEEAFSKLEKTIYDNEYVISSALTDLNDKIEDIPIYGTTNKLSADYIENGSTNKVINVQADWNQTIATADDYIKNKPTIPTAQIQADWNQTTTTAADYIKNKPTIPVVSSTVTQNDPNPVSGSAVYGKFEDLIGAAPAALDTLQEIASALNNDADLASTLTTQISTKIPKVSNPTVDNFASFNSDGTIKDSGLSASSFITIETQPDWNETATTNAAYIQNKPIIPDEQIQSDWNQTDDTAKDYIKNKPELPVDYSKKYLTFVALEAGTFSFTMQAKITTDVVPSMSYSTDNGETWTTVENVNNEEVVLTTPTILAGNKVLWKSNSVQYDTNPDSHHGGNFAKCVFSSTCEFNIEGNIMSLIYNDNFIEETSLKTLISTGRDAGTFSYLFSNSQVVSAEYLKLFATTLTNYCYAYMFYGCTKLVKAPELPATTLVSSCYADMFLNCTRLVNAPELPATTLVDSCYYGMFNGCTSLTKASELPAIIMQAGCYSTMFKGCTSLITAPELPANTLAKACYQNMFEDCTSLVNAPELPANTLASSCYAWMFRNCTSLVNAPELPANTLASSCYYSMFQGCTNLVKAPELPAITLASNCYGNMFQGCTGIHYIKALFTITPSNTYTQDWVKNVPATGTFVKNSAATWNVRGFNGIPSGWKVYTDDEFEVVRHYELDNELDNVLNTINNINNIITPTNISSTLSTNKFTRINNKLINQILIPIDKSKNNYNGDLLSNTTIIPYISNAEKYLALQIGNVIQESYVIIESNLIGKGFYSNTSILYNNDIVQIYTTLPLNLIKDNLQYLMLSYYVELNNLFIWFDDFADGSTDTQDLNEWVANDSDTTANNWNDYVENYLLEDYPGYRSANCYHYTNETYTWEGEEYYLWSGIITGNQEPMEYILTNTINYNELYSHSLESDSSNHWCPYVVKFNKDGAEYTAENSNDILIKVSNDSYVLQDAWILYIQGGGASWTDWDDYCNNYLLNKNENYGNPNFYDYTGDTYEWEGVEYYVWEHDRGDYYILTNTIDYNELYNKSIEANHYNMNCPYVAMFDKDMQLMYNGDERKNDWLIKVIASNNDSNQAAIILTDDFVKQ